MLKKQDQSLAENKQTIFTFNGEPVNDKLDHSEKRFAALLANQALSPAACKLFELVSNYLADKLQLRHQMSTT
jgi:hypothetical protein